MADEHLTEGSDWVDQIFQVALDTKWKGGADGTANMQAQALAARTRYLKALLEGLNEGKQPLAAILTALAALPGAADKVPYFTGDDTLALTTLTAFCRTVLEATSAANFREAIGAVSAEDISQAVAALVNSSPVTLDTLAELATALGNDPNFATTITTALANKQPLDATLTALAAVVTAADKLIYATGSDTFSTTPLSAFIRTLLGNQDATAARATLGAAAIGDLVMPSGTPLWWLTPTCPTWALVRDGSAISRAAYPKLFAALCPTRSGTTATGTNVVSGLSTTTDLYVGMPVEGAGIPAGTTVSGITSGSSVNLSANATASATVPITLFYYGYGSGGSAATFGLPDDRGLFERGLDTGARGYEITTIVGNVTSGSQAVTGLASTKGLAFGQPLTGNAIPAGATVQSITSATAITISAPATATGATSITFSGGQIANERADTFRSHNHQIWGDVIQSFAGGGALPTANMTGLEAWCATELTGGAETRPRSRSYLPIIVY